MFMAGRFEKWCKGGSLPVFCPDLVLWAVLGGQADACVLTAAHHSSQGQAFNAEAPFEDRHSLGR